jgi:hypothetical protein
VRTPIVLRTLRRMTALSASDGIAVSRRFAVKLVLAATNHANAIVIADGTVETTLDEPVIADKPSESAVDDAFDATIDDAIDGDEVKS